MAVLTLSQDIGAYRGRTMPCTDPNTWNPAEATEMDRKRQDHAR